MSTEAGSTRSPAAYRSPAASRPPTTPLRFAGDLLRLARPHTCVAGFVEVLLGAHVVEPARLVNGRAIVAGVSAIFLVAAAQSFNDAKDVAADRSTKPNRPVASGRISVRLARVYALTCVLLGVAVAALLGSYWMVLAAAFAAAVSVAYSMWLKNTVLVGNIVVALMASCMVAYGALSVNRITLLVAGVCVGITVYQTGFEILKTLRDKDEDARAGLRTLASLDGRVAVWLARLAIVAAVAMLLAGGATSAYRPAYFLIAGLGVVAPNAVAAVVVRDPSDASAVRRALALMRLGWLPALVAMFLLGTG